MFKTLLRTLSAFSIVTITASAGFAQDDPPAVDCEIIANANNSACNVTREVWKNSFKIKGTPLLLSFRGTSNQFIATDTPELLYSPNERINIKFQTYDGSHPVYAGSAGFRRHTINGGYGYSAAVLDPINLGAPLSDFAPSARWSGKIKGLTSNGTIVGYSIGAKFDLLVNFTHGFGNKWGSISATIRDSIGSSEYNYDIHGSFNNRGVITGTINVREIGSSDSTSGILSGIIGEKGALGVFYSTGSGGFAYAGGFRAVGPLESEWDLLKTCAATPFADHCVNDARLLVRRCNQDYNRAECTGESFVTSRCNDDPFRAECTDESFVTPRCNDDPFRAECTDGRFNVPKSKRIAFCIEGSNARSEDPHKCENAIKEHNCIRDPFQDDCQRTFAEYYVSARANREILCDANMFDSLCGSKYSSARIDFCADANNAGDPKCNHLLSTPNAARLSQSFNFEGLNTENRTNQFLQGTEAELTASKDGLTIEQPTDESSHEGSLNLAVLGRDASNGVSFFKGNNGTNVFHYAGIFSSTDLGEPLTSTQPNAYWKGKFQVTGYLPSTDFTLEINFGDTGGAGNIDDDRVGRIQAFVRVGGSLKHFYVDGGFTDKGVITGDVTYGFFANNNRKRPSSRTTKGEVRGLIGEKGAVAAFISNNNAGLGYAGGFVARQTTPLEKSQLDATCADDPFSGKCKVGFEAERDAEVARCKDNREQEIADGYCDGVVQPIITDCTANPFAPKCVALNSFKAARATIVNRCGNRANTDRTGCSNVAHIITDCNLNPFGVYCDVQAFEQKRTDFSTDCIANGNCDDVQRKPNAATWHSTANPFANVNAANVDGGFVRGTEDNLAGGDGLVPANVTKLNLSTATFGGSDKPLGGEAADGLAFGTDSGNKHYAGIFSGTDLGAPVAQKVGRASWVGSVSFTRGGLVVLRNTRDFVLEVNFVDRKIDADTDVIRIAGEFNDNGVISGKAIDNFLSGKPQATLSGLIGEEGAVGVFINEDNKFSGGFVARPPNSDQMASLNATCASFANDIFRSHNSVYSANCSLEAAAEKDSLIKKCITGANAKTDECNDTALEAADVKAAVVACIKNPFGTECDMTLGDNYDVALGNRSKFCNNFLNAEHEFCKGDNRDLVCGYDPFNAICVGDIYHSEREQRCADENERDSVRCKPTVARICVDNSDIFNRVCGDDYNDPRLDICRNEYDNGPSARCTATVTRICTNDVFDDLCKHDAYFDNRVTACRGRDDDSRCTETITTACQRDLFDPFCDATHSDARKTRINLCNNLTGDVPEPNCMGDNLTNLCRYDPFNAVCPSANNNARAVELLEMCANSAQADNLDCISILKRPNAATLLQARPAETLVTTGESNQFLNATKTTDPEKSGLDGLEAAVNPQTFELASGDARSLNLSDLDTDGVEGDADDGVGYAAIETIRTIPRYRGQRKFRHFAGIFSSTDLGAPLTQTNTKVGWNGKIEVAGYSLRDKSDINFTLEITFGNAGAGGKIEAFVHELVEYYFYLEGGFDSKGLLIGTATYGIFAGRDRNGEIAEEGKIEGTLRGLIGQDGAVGAFVSKANVERSGFAGFSGGFVARPLTAGETTTLNTTCDMNPFHADCYFGFDAERNARLVLCQEDGRAIEAGCTGGANAIITDCTANPFSEDCTWDAFDAKRNERVTICYDAAADDERCVGTAATIVTDCKTNPFGADCGFDTFDDARNTLITTCHDGGECTDAVLERPNAGTWANSFKTDDNLEELSDVPDAVNQQRKFLKNIESAAQSDSGIQIYINPDYPSNLGTTYKSLDLSTAEFSIDGMGTDLGGDAKDGMAHLLGRDSGQEYDSRYAGYNAYAGIFSTTDLGAPLTIPLDNEPKTASWVGIFSMGDPIRNISPQDFVLEINFASQSIEAFVSSYHLIKGDYDDNGVISGTIIGGDFIDNNRSKVRWIYIPSQILTGLIGKEGAVGVYLNGGFVARPADLVVNTTTNKNAETFLNETCTGNPFHPFCYLSNHRKTRIDDCITGKDVLSDNCKKARELHSCLRHPFDEQCKTTFHYHNDTMDKPYYEIARKNRSAFCNVPANETDDFCMGAERVALCSYDPFNRICDNTNSLYNNARQAVCKAGFDHPDCATETYRPPLKNKVTAISWLSGLYKDKGVVPQTEPDTIRPQNQFLQGTVDGLDNGDVEIYSHSFVSSYYSLNLNTATFDGLELGLGKNTKSREAAADDGVAWFRGGGKLYAGIFSGTDLGEPLVKTAKNTATWYGQFQAGSNKRKDFTLDINFSAGGTDGTVEAFVHSSGTSYYLLDGKFDSNGVISGTVDWGQFANHDRIFTDIGYTSVLTGLIGQDGAVGVFGSGGFVAVPKDVIPFDPNVKFSDWVRSFGNTPLLPNDLPYYNDPQQARFLRASTYLSANNLRDTVQPRPLRLSDVNTGGELADSVAYVSGERRRDYNPQTRSYKTITKHHYAGILSGTNLGAALPTVPAGANGAITAIWDGKLGLIANRVEIPKRDIKLTVDFTNKRISHKSEVGGAHLVDFSATWNSGVGYDGVLTGEITYDKTPTLQTDGSYVASDGSKSAGKVTGLIGQQGAVGAFISDHGDNHAGTNTPYAGGFVAAPPAETASP